MKNWTSQIRVNSVISTTLLWQVLKRYSVFFFSFVKLQMVKPEYLMKDTVRRMSSRLPLSFWSRVVWFSFGQHRCRSWLRFGQSCSICLAVNSVMLSFWRGHWPLWPIINFVWRWWLSLLWPVKDADESISSSAGALLWFWLLWMRYSVIPYFVQTNKTKRRLIFV